MFWNPIISISDLILMVLRMNFVCKENTVLRIVLVWIPAAHNTYIALDELLLLLLFSSERFFLFLCKNML